MVMERIDRQGVNVGNKLSMAFLGPRYGGSVKHNIVIAGDIVEMGSAGNIREVFTEKPRLNSMTYLFDHWEITENITFQLDSYIPEIDRMAGRFNIASNVSRAVNDHIRTTVNTEDAENYTRPRIMIFPALQDASPGSGGGRAKNGMLILAEGLWIPSNIAWQRGNLITYDIEFLPNHKYVRTVSGPLDDELSLAGLSGRADRLIADPFNADRYHDFDRDVHYIDGVNHTVERERRMGLLAAG